MDYGVSEGGRECGEMELISSLRRWDGGVMAVWLEKPSGFSRRKLEARNGQDRPGKGKGLGYLLTGM